VKILIVEDDATWLRTIEEHLKRIPSLVVTTALSRDSAFDLLASGSYDLIVSDLKLPTSDHELDIEEAHGESVIARARELHPGTPLLILSAFGTIDFATETLIAADRLDIVGDGVEELMVSYRSKGGIDKGIAAIETFCDRLRKTEAIEIRRSGAGSGLSPSHARAIRIFARHVGGHSVQVAALRGGLSGTSTYRVQVKDANGQLRAHAFAKIGPLEIVKEEVSRFQRFVVVMLPPGGFATLQHHVRGGCSNVAAVFYQLVDGSQSLSQLLLSKPGGAGEIVNKIAECTNKWYSTGPQGEMSVQDLRKRSGVDKLDEILPLLEDLDYQSIEGRIVSAKSAIQHGDLHTDNVLIYDSNRPVLIDFGEVDERFAGFDPLTLELSVIFHPSGKTLRGDWPSVAQAENWEKLDEYLVNCPVPDFIRACRAWIDVASPTDESTAACLYVYAVRQLRYADTDKDLARAFIRCAGRLLT